MFNNVTVQEIKNRIAEVKFASLYFESEEGLIYTGRINQLEMDGKYKVVFSTNIAAYSISTKTFSTKYLAKHIKAKNIKADW